MLVLGPYGKDRKYSRNKANICNPNVNRDCPSLATNRTSADCVENTLVPSIQHIPLGVYHTGVFNSMRYRQPAINQLRSDRWLTRRTIYIHIYYICIYTHIHTHTHTHTYIYIHMYLLISILPKVSILGFSLERRVLSYIDLLPRVSPVSFK